MQLILIITIILILSFSVTNGMNDGCTVMATAVASLSIPRRYALIIVTISEFLGPFVFGIPVAITMASGIINVSIIPHTVGSLTLILSGIMGAIIVNLLAWLFRLPTSATFSLVGGMIGPAIFRYGKDAVPWAIFLTKVLGAMFLSPVLGILFGYTIYNILKSLLRNSPFKANRYLKRTQLVTLVALGLSHGTNDSQKAMGLISLALLFAGKIPELTIPLWVMTISAAALAMGITMGGTKMIKTVGYGIFNIKPIHSFAAQISAFSILFTCNLTGVPVSTSQIISSSVIGVGSAHRGKGVRWTLIYNILLSWIVTIPLAGLSSTLVYVIITQVFLKR
ncbi:MAG: inorganic phosphate transporter [Spirochaetes bacterium]|nr:inorganic phosphate transporter [Spirochaetota bacterium]